MQLRSLLSGRDWLDRGMEAVWSRAPRHRLDPVTLAHALDPADLAEVRILWPSRYAWEPRRILGEQVRQALANFVRVEETEVPQPFQGVVSAVAEVGGRRFRLSIETSDYAPLNEEAYEASDLHFKMEYSLEGYGARERLRPGAYVNADAVIYAYLPRLRAMRDQLPSRYEVYGRYGLSMEKRRKPLEILRSSRAFRYDGGEGKVRYSRYLREVARAKVCIDLPSMSSITFRMMDLLAVGSCIVGPPHTNQLLAPFQDGVHVAYCKADYSDLEEVCVRYLEDEEARNELVRNSRAFFDSFAHRDQLACHYLHEILQLAGAERSTGPATTASQGAVL